MIRHILEETISSTTGALELGTKTARALRLAARRLALAYRIAGERHDLARLNERMLKDIGLSRSMAYRESARDFLDIPKAREPRNW